MQSHATTSSLVIANACHRKNCNMPIVHPAAVILSGRERPSMELAYLTLEMATASQNWIWEERIVPRWMPRRAVKAQVYAAKYWFERFVFGTILLCGMMEVQRQARGSLATSQRQCGCGDGTFRRHANSPTSGVFWCQYFPRNRGLSLDCPILPSIGGQS